MAKIEKTDKEKLDNIKNKIKKDREEATAMLESLDKEGIPDIVRIELEMKRDVLQELENEI